jgi:hypothetical protein
MESEEVSHKFFEVLEKINKLQQFTAGDKLTYELGFDKFVFGETPKIEEERKILKKLEEMGAIKIISSYGNDLPY